MTSSLFEPVDDFISRAGQLGLELDRAQKLLSPKSSPEEPELLNVFPRAYFVKFELALQAPAISNNLELEKCQGHFHHSNNFAKLKPNFFRF